MLLAATLVPAAAVGAETDPAASMFQPGVVVAIDLTLPQASEDALKADPHSDAYVQASFSLAETDGTPAGTGQFSAPVPVGVRLKGGTGSFRTLEEKAGFKIKFKEFGGAKFRGLKKLTLNNMVQDPSMIHETLTYDTFRSLGVPAPRTGFAYLRVNGEDYGVYLNVETPDDVFLPRWFASTRHLYEADEAGLDVAPGEAGKFEADEGDEDDRTDLEALIAAANSTAGDWSDGMAAVADLTEMTRMWAVERFVGHWDGYAGLAGAFRPNNYYLHSLESGLFQMLPWGTDQTWVTRVEFDEPAGGLLFNHCLDDSDCLALYEGALQETQASVARLDLDKEATCAAERLAPWQAMETEQRREYDPTEIAEGVAQVRDFIAERPAELADWLGLEAPDPVVSQGPCPGTEKPSDPGEPVSDPGPVAAPAPVSDSIVGVVPEVSPGSFHLRRVRVARGGLTARFQVSAPGRVDLRASIGAGEAGMPACRATATAAAAGSISVRCRFSKAVRRRFEARWLRLRLQGGFTPDTGASTAIVKVVRVPRTASATARQFAP
jgi:CotH protein